MHSHKCRTLAERDGGHGLLGLEIVDSDESLQRKALILLLSPTTRQEIVAPSVHVIDRARVSLPAINYRKRLRVEDVDGAVVRCGTYVLIRTPHQGERNGWFQAERLNNSAFLHIDSIHLALTPRYHQLRGRGIYKTHTPKIDHVAVRNVPLCQAPSVRKVHPAG